MATNPFDDKLLDESDEERAERERAEREEIEESDRSLEDEARAFGIPWPLMKASADPFVYAVGLRTGEILEFESCEFDKDHVWVTLHGVRNHSIRFPRDLSTQSERRGVYKPSADPDHPMIFRRGFAVRIADIMWAADAPWEW